MKSRFAATAGFTLIELLTVIAIIAILAGLTSLVLPRALESARVTEADNIANQLRILLTDYYSAHGTYPPAYGYLVEEQFDKRPSEINTADQTDDANPPIWETRSYMAILGEQGNEDLYDPFSDGVNVNSEGDDLIDYLEFSPIGGHDPAAFAAGEVDNGFMTVLYDSAAPDARLNSEITKQKEATIRPYLYFPINKRQFNKVMKMWFDLADTNAMAGFPPNNDGDLTNDSPRPNDAVAVNTALADLEFPPAKYDAYVLISLGPQGHGTTARALNGMLMDLTSGRINLANAAYPATPTSDGVPIKDVYRYHYLGMAAYFMATRDAGDNNVLDFDFKGRTREDEAGLTWVDGGGNEQLQNLFDDPAMSNPAGPLIYPSE